MTFGLALKMLTESQYPGVMAEVTRQGTEVLRNTKREPRQECRLKGRGVRQRGRRENLGLLSGQRKFDLFER